MNTLRWAQGLPRIESDRGMQQPLDGLAACPRWTPTAPEQRRLGTVSTAKRMEMLVIQLPRGRSAVVQFDPARSTTVTDHCGFRALLEYGILDWNGHRCFPADGHRFFSALYDHLFLSGYRVRWLTWTPAARPRTW